MFHHQSGALCLPRYSLCELRTELIEAAMHKIERKRRLYALVPLSAQHTR